ncbi:YbaB/EbfC family nucleoid-associated protein [Actinomadura geliboluensis]|uniref:YbaB/EbfC family nucleoid-associated protein n=1 Tax=Actinomadura geliboluensis TaxID=882440 RepID=UPI0036A8EFAA
MNEPKAIPDPGVPTELQGLLKGAQELQRRLPELSRRLAEVTGVGRSSDGLVTVVTDSRGSVRSVEVSPRRYAEMAAESLASDVIAAAAAARGDAERRVAEICGADPTGTLADALKGEFRVPKVAEDALARIHSRLSSQG